MFRTASTAIITVVLANITFASDIDTLKKDYLKRETLLIQHYNDGILAKSQYIAYEYDGKKLEPPFTNYIEALTGRGSTKYQMRNSNNISHSLLLPDNGYAIEEEQKGRYKIKGQVKSYGDESVFPHPGIHPEAPQSFPLRFYDFNLDSLVGDVLRNSDPNVKSRFAKVNIVSVGKETWYGQEAVVMTCLFLTGKPSKVYLDPKNDYAYLCFDSDTNSGRLEYGSQPGFDYPIPKRFDFWRYGAKKEKIRMYSVEIDEFKRVEVTPDDFDIEKQYGLKPLPPNRIIAAQTNRWAKWFYISGAVFAVISVLLIVIIRRRRTQALA